MDVVYLDNAATTFPKPKEVYDYMMDMYKNHGINVGRGKSSSTVSIDMIINDTREMLKELVNAKDSYEAVFAPSATIALNQILFGLDYSSIKNIYITKFEHNAVLRTLNEIKKREDINIHFLDFDGNEWDYDYDEIKYKFSNAKPDLVIVNHTSNVFGYTSNIEKIYEVSQEYNPKYIIDASQSLGVESIDVCKCKFDFIVFAGHKTLYGPTGISGFVMNPLVKFPAVIFGGTGYESANQDMPEDLPQKYEMGTLNIAGIAGLNAALGWSAQVTIDAIREKEAENRKKLIDLLGRYSYIKIIGNYDSCNYVGIVSCIIEGISSDSAGPVFDRCGIAVRTGLQCAPLAHQFIGTFPAGTIRFSVNYFTTDKDFAELEEALDYIDSEL